MTEKIVLAYSGGLDTSVAIPWLMDKGYEVIAVVLNVNRMRILTRFNKKRLKSVPLIRLSLTPKTSSPITMLRRSSRPMRYTKATIR